MTNSVDQQMTEIYCFVDDFFKTYPLLAQWRRLPHAQPLFSDAEVLTFALLQGVFAVATFKPTYRLAARHWRGAFPHLPSHKQWIKRAHPLLPQVGRLLATTCQHLPTAARLYLIDSTPIPLCHNLRHGRVRLLRDEGADFGRSSKGGFFGFKLYLLRHISRRVMNPILTPGNWDDRDPAPALVQSVDGGVTLGDLGYHRVECGARLAEDAEMLLITRDRTPSHKFMSSQVRQ